MGRRLIGRNKIASLGSLPGFQVEDDLCYFPLCREVTCEHYSTEYLCEVFDTSERNSCRICRDEVVDWGTFRFEVVDDGLNF
jgi:hypothetical protein